MYYKGLQNYCSFYVQEPFLESSLDATSTPDYCYYNMLKVWRRGDRSFNYHDAHCLTYMLRERWKDYEKEVLPIIRKRLDNSKNLILILTEYTRKSNIMEAECYYAMVVKGLPVVVTYPELTKEEIFTPDGEVSEQAKSLWEKAPVFKQFKDKVYVQHVPFSQQAIHEAINNVDKFLNI